MENYISINGQKVDLTQEQVEKIREIFSVSGKRLADYPVASVIKIGEYEMIVLDHDDGGTLLLRKESLKEISFGASNNYDGSNADMVCSDFAKEIAAIVGEDNILLHDVDLTSDDGLKDYGIIKRRASLLTADMYRKFVEVLDEYRLDDWWWLATPHSTPRHGNDDWVKCVSPSGYIVYVGYYDGDGVRPFCILNSNIFVSM